MDWSASNLDWLESSSDLTVSCLEKLVDKLEMLGNNLEKLLPLETLGRDSYLVLDCLDFLVVANKPSKLETFRMHLKHLTVRSSLLQVSFHFPVL